jgi:hypothetical protein
MNLPSQGQHLVEYGPASNWDKPVIIKFRDILRLLNNFKNINYGNLL